MTPELTRLIEMHTYCRPAGSAVESAFIARYITALGAVSDIYGNYMLVVGDTPRHAFSCHTDTVHRHSQRQRVRYRHGTLRSRSGDCLGADDTAGVWLMGELIRRQVPGRYLFHYGEECGCIGSRALVASYPEWLANLDMVIALDRKSTSDIITHQCGLRTASDEFATALADQFNAGDTRLTYAPSSHGLSTDSESYADAIAECTNLSIGYQGNHSAAETLDCNHALRLLDRLSYLDVAALPVVRKPGENDFTGFGLHDSTFWDTYTGDLTSPVVKYPRVVSLSWCKECGDDCRDYQPICYTCGCDDPTGVTIRNTDYLDAVYGDVQRELRIQMKKGQR